MAEFTKSKTKSDKYTMALELTPLSPRKESSDPIQNREFLYPDIEIKRKLQERENIFGVPGASLTWGIAGSSQGQIDSGLDGEKQVAKVLATYAEKHPEVKVFHSIQWPGSQGDTDHMLVVGNIVFIIDAKRWKSSRKYSVTPKGAILRGTVAFPEGKVKMMPAMAAWRKVLPNTAKVLGVVCIAQEKVFVPYDNNWWKAPFKLVTAEKLEEFLDNMIAKQKPELVKAKNLDIILPIARKVIKPRDRRSEIINVAAMKRNP